MRGSGPGWWTTRSPAFPTSSLPCDWSYRWPGAESRESNLRPSAATERLLRVVAASPRRTEDGRVELADYREEFPVLGRKAYLISASLGPMSRRAQGYLREYMDAWATKGAPDHVWPEDIFPRMGSVKRTFGSMVGADP